MVVSSKDSPIDHQLDSGAGWVVVGATFLSTFTVFGVAYSFGSFFKPMAEEFDSGRSGTAFVFSITTFLYFTLGMFTGRLADRVGPRRVLVVGGACMVAGLLATSVVNSLVLGYITYGVGVGIGVACAYVPMVGNVGGWFARRRTMALGVAVAGIGVGTLVGSPLTERLIEAYGWRRTYVLLAAGCSVLFGLASLGANQAPAVVGAQPPPMWAVVKSSREFQTLYLSIVLLTLVLFVPFVFLADYVDVANVPTSRFRSAGWLVASIGVSSVVGRIGLGSLGSRVSVLRLYQSSFLVMSLSFLLWLFADTSYVMLLVFTVVMGIAYGGFIALGPAVMAEIFGPLGLGGLLGALYSGAGVGALIGPPLAGAIIDASGYRATLIAAMVVQFLAFILLLPLDVRRPTETAAGN